MKNNTEDKRKDSIKATLLKALKITLIVIFSSACLTGLGFLLWFKVIRTNKVHLTEALPKTASVSKTGRGTYLSDIEPFNGEVYMAYTYDSNISDNIFVSLFGFDPVTIHPPIKSIRMMEKYISGTLCECDDDDFPSYVLFGIDPYSAYKQSCSNRELFLKNLEFYAETARSHPDTRFFFILPEDSYYRWTSLSDDDLSKARLSYILLVRALEDTPNTCVLYYPVEEWVLYSSSIRDGGPDSPISGEIYDHLLAACLSGTEMSPILRIDTVNTLMDRIIEQSKDYENIRATYADLSEKKIFFLGDSIFGNYRDGTSVSSFFADMTGARPYNLGQGGMSAVNLANPNEPLGMAFIHLTGKLDRTAFDSAFSSYYSYGDFGLATASLLGSAGEDSYFVIEYGLNDYFGGVSVEEYKNALNTIVSDLLNAYPAAGILVLSPGYIDIYSQGNEPLSQDGAPLQDYRDAAREIAESNGCGFLSQTDDLGFTQEDTGIFLLPDHVHYNEIGRYRLAQGLARYFK